MNVYDFIKINTTEELKSNKISKELITLLKNNTKFSSISFIILEEGSRSGTDLFFKHNENGKLILTYENPEVTYYSSYNTLKINDEVIHASRIYSYQVDATPSVI